MTRTPIALAAAFAALLLGSQVVFADDEIEYRKAGKVERIRGRVVDESSRKVIVQSRDGDVEIPSYEIIRIRYDRQPTDLITIRGYMDAERYEDAVAALKPVYGLVKTGQNEFLKADVAFQLVAASVGAAKRNPQAIEDAVAAVENFEKNYKRSRHDDAFNLLAGELAMTRGAFEEAKKYYANLRLSEAPGARSKSINMEGLALLRSGKASQAIGNFDQVLGTAKDEDQKRGAQIFKAAAMLEGKPSSARVAEAEKLLTESLKDVSSSDGLVKAVGYNAMGDLLRLQNKPPKEVLIRGYMFVLMLYDVDPAESAKALYNAHLLFGEIGQRNRAEDMAKSLIERYPSSTWAKKLPPTAAGGNS